MVCSGCSGMDTTLSSPAAFDTLPVSPRRQTPALDEDDRLIPHFIRAEANLLRLPLFALHTKGLRTLDGIECSGRRLDGDGQLHDFTFRATRNTATLYPGPLARAVHLAFLSIMTEQGL